MRWFIGQITFWLHKRSIHVRLIILLAYILNFLVCTSCQAMGANQIFACSRITWFAYFTWLTWSTWIHLIHLTNLSAPVVKWWEQAGSLPQNACLQPNHPDLSVSPDSPNSPDLYQLSSDGTQQAPPVGCLLAPVSPDLPELHNSSDSPDLPVSSPELPDSPSCRAMGRSRHSPAGCLTSSSQSSSLASFTIRSLLAKDLCIKINFMPRFINCLQGVNESRIRLAVYRAVDSALDEYSKTVEDVSAVCTLKCAMCKVRCVMFKEDCEGC